MKLAMYGVSHHTCAVEEREKLNFSHDEQFAILRQMHSVPDIAEALIINTCNRLEFYVYTSKNFDAKEYIDKLIAAQRPEGAAAWRTCGHEHFGINAVGHLFRVAAGLDSQMLGENQVVAQLKSAYAVSLECHTSRFLFHRLMHSAFHVGKAVRTETDINCGAVSVSLAAVDMARKKMDLAANSAMIIGAGENAELAARYLVENGIRELIIANRNVESAASMAARLKMGRAIRLDEIAANLNAVDLVIASTGAVEPVVRREDVEGVLAKRGRPLMMIDVAVPRDIEHEVGEIEGVRLFNIDDLKERVDPNKSPDDKQIPKALAIVDEHVKEFKAWLDSLTMVPVISELTKRMVQIARSEAKRYAGDVNMQSDKLEVFAESLARKILHGPISFLKSTGDDEPNFEQLQAVNLLNRMFFGNEGAKGQ